MELRTISIWLVSVALLASGCYYDVEEELYPTIECQTTDMSYMDDILPIIESNCMVCHSAAANFGNITLEGYTQLRKYVDDGSFVGAIRHEGGYSPMPKNQAKLLNCEIEKIEAWVADGSLDN